MVWAPGQELCGNGYIIEQQLGEGGFGITYLARNRNGQPAVIKTLKDELLRHRDFALYRDKFRRGALLLSLCRHPNIVQIENAFSEGQLPCIAMEYVEGEDLWERVSHRGAISESEALRYIRQIGEALQALHEKGLQHGDIKPANIMVRAGLSEAVLIDFGLALGYIPDLTEHDTPALSDSFAPPEKYRLEARRGEDTDVYALAATLYYLVTETMPAPAPLRALNNPLKPPAEINPSISDEVSEAIMLGMEMDATSRPQSVRDWLRLLPGGGAGGSAPPVQLVSAVGVDYSKLRDLLAAGKWEEADRETRSVMLKAAGREKDGWLREKDMDNFPCPDLRTLDELWVHYSHGRFGFSVQKRIYQSLGGTRNYDKIWNAFGESVGWKVKGSDWLDGKEFTFNVNAQPAHLPGVAGWGWGLKGCGFFWVFWFSSLASRLVKCNL